MSLMVGHDAFDYDVVGGDDDDGGRAPLTGARAIVWQCGCTPLYFCQISP